MKSVIKKNSVSSPITAPLTFSHFEGLSFLGKVVPRSGKSTNSIHPSFKGLERWARNVRALSFLFFAFLPRERNHPSGLSAFFSTTCRQKGDCDHKQDRQSSQYHRQTVDGFFFQCLHD